MNNRQYLTLFLAGLLVAAAMAIFHSAPGYMDADYYFAGGKRLAAGFGFNEAFIWNFLDDPQGIPHPSHTYWMPLTSLIAALGIRLFSTLHAYQAAQMPFLLLTSVLPPLTAAFAYRLYMEEEKALLAGWLAVFPGFYLAYYLTTDAFLLYSLLGGIFLWRSCRLDKWHHFLVLGLIVGLMHMARADGLLWLMVALAAAWQQREKINPWFSAILLVLGYMLAAGGWLWRNLTTFGSLFSPGAGHSLWMLDYDELFIYPASQLTFARWWQAGLEALLSARWQALLINLQTAAVVEGMIFLGPLALVGAWRLRKQPVVWLGAMAWCMTFIVMTVVFPFSGARGGFFHSGAALMPLVWALAPSGLGVAIRTMGSKRGWHADQAWRVLQAGLVGLAALMTLILAVEKAGRSWEATTIRYQILENELVGSGASIEDIVMVNNPPAYYAANDRPAVVIPHGNLDVLLEVAWRYQVKYLILDESNSKTLGDLYQDPQDVPGMRYIGSRDGKHIFIFEQP